MDNLIPAVRTALIQAVDERTLATAGRFFKPDERAKIHGVKMPEAQKIAKLYWAQIKGHSKQEVLAWCELLWQSGYLEEAMVACHWAEQLHKQYAPEDWEVWQRWVHRYVTCWADCDTLCNHTVGNFVMMYPRYVNELKRWASTSTVRWGRRAAAVSLIIPARRGLFLDDILHIADTLLLDPDDLVQKGYGWMLKAASEAHPHAILDYVLAKRQVMPRTALRYAIEKMPPDWRAEAMRK